MSFKEKLEFAYNALSLLKDWSIWLVSIQTAAIGFLGVYYRSKVSNNSKILMVVCLFGFAFSIIFAALVLGGIPSIASQLLMKRDLTDNIFTMNFQDKINIPIYYLTYAEFIFFIIGIISLSILVFIESAIKPNKGQKGEGGK